MAKHDHFVYEISQIMLDLWPRIWWQLDQSLHFSTVGFAQCNLTIYCALSCWCYSESGYSVALDLIGEIFAGSITDIINKHWSVALIVIILCRVNIIDRK